MLTGVTHDRMAWPFDDDRAGAALAEPAAELRSAQLEVVAEDVQQRRRRIDIHGLRPAVHLQRQTGHHGEDKTRRVSFTEIVKLTRRVLPGR